MLMDHFGIESLFCVAGGSMGGMQVLQWAASYPDRVFSALPIATAAKHSAQNIAFHEVGRQAMMADPDWRAGAISKRARGRQGPRRGAHGRAHHLSLGAALHRKFGRKLQDREAPTFSFDADFQIESYLRYQGISFVERFDANSYLYVTRAMDYFDLAADHGGVLAKAFGHEDALLHRVLHLRLAVPDHRFARDRACAERRGRLGVLRRARERQGARRLPAGGAQDVRDDARLPRSAARAGDLRTRP
jgi:homoserine O-acetyltransferase